MKRIRCPKCENYLTFDETKYSDGQSLVFVCENCGKQFSIRIKPKQREEEEKEAINQKALGSITVIENVFGYKQVLLLFEGDNTIGRRCKGTEITTAIDSGDMSMDRRHCVIRIQRNKQGELIYSLRDNPSLTGTFLFNEILGNNDIINLDDGAIVTIGATTFIFHIEQEKKE